MEKKYTEEEILNLWSELEDIPFDEDEDGVMCLGQDYFIFHKGDSRDYIWEWFDRHWEYGITNLLNSI